MPLTSLSRRKVLQLATVGAGLGLLQGCQTMSNPLEASAPQPESPPISPTTNAAACTLYFAACSGLLPKPAQGDIAQQRLSMAGYQLENTAALSRAYQRFAGTDAERLNDLHQLLKRSTLPNIILAMRGGYGATRLLPHIDYARLCPMLKEAGSLLVGYSDFSAIQLALLAKGGVGSFAGPMVGEFGSAQPNAFAMDEFFSVTTTPKRSLHVEGYYPNAQGEGLFWGGNLSVLSSLVGTPYLPDIKGGLLFLEDVSEQPYRIERMLQQLYQAGILGQQSAIFMGNFNMSRQVDVYDPYYDLNVVMQEMRRLTGVPVFHNIPFGHVSYKTTLPLGFAASYQAGPTGLTLSFEDYPTVPVGNLQRDALNLAF